MMEQYITSTQLGTVSSQGTDKYAKPGGKEGEKGVLALGRV